MTHMLARVLLDWTRIMLCNQCYKQALFVPNHVTVIAKSVHDDRLANLISLSNIAVSKCECCVTFSFSFKLVDIMQSIDHVAASVNVSTTVLRFMRWRA